MQVHCIFVVRNVAGADTDVSFDLNTGQGPQGVSMQPATVHVPQGGQQAISLHFTVSPDAPIVSNQNLLILSSAFNGAFNRPVDGPAINIIPGQVTVSLMNPGDIPVTLDSSIDVPIRIGLGSLRGFTNVIFTAGSLPRGISIDPHVFFPLSDNPDVRIDWPDTNVGPDGSTTVNIQVKIDPTTLSGRNPAVLNWSAWDGAQTGSITLNFVVLVRALNPNRASLKGKEISIRPRSMPRAQSGDSRINHCCSLPSKFHVQSKFPQLNSLWRGRPIV
jgi:hypothetical protein